MSTRPGPPLHATSGWEYKALFDATDEGFCILQIQFDAAGAAVDAGFVEANPSFTRHTGLRDVVGRSSSTLLANSEGYWLRVFGEVARTGNPVRISDRADALGRWFDVHAFRIGEPQHALVAVRFNDITERRRTQERLASVQRIKTVGVMFWGEGFSLVDMNDGFLGMMGMTREEALGLTWQQLTPPEFHAVSLQAVREVVTVGESMPYEKQYIRKDGTRWWGLFAARRIGDEVVEFVQDVSEQKQAEEALREADRRKDEFLATLAHELRNPLAPIRNGLQVLRLSTPPEASAQRTVEVMDRQLDHLVRLVDDLLDVARISAGKVRIERRVIPVREVLARSIEATQLAINARHHLLQLELPEQEIYVEGDLDRLAQVFSNLLSNAAKYTEPGGRITLQLSARGEQVFVSVSDTGIGIPREQQERVFELFSQVRDHQRHAEGGLGIGLSLVNSLVRLHGGSVTVESEGAGKGSTFCVQLPRAFVAVAAAAAPSEATTGASAPAPRRLLIADDNEDAADTLAILLRVEGHEVVTAGDGEQAVEQARSFAPDLAFIDLGMPGMGGLQAAREIRRLPAGDRIRLVALTGWGQAADRERSRLAGFDLHLVKPLSAAGLREALQLLPPKR
ncbi:ATP-binding protein [Ramlibacter sp.]|uniref:ATP-binding protein n=1 Tax=Ramlibacter sp. TaxID=1917967 RepID=UPI0026225659|nr:ATP-binding protein [Ramlibacter sp.]MDB5956136.1 putative histidine kinase, hybrid [Ramlibacter sp.]